MKKTILILFAITPILVLSQEIKVNEESEKYEYQQIIELEGKSKNELFDKTKEWIALNYKSAHDVVQYESKENGKIIAKGNFVSSMFGKKGWVRHTVIFDFKDNKMRVTYTDFSYYSSGSGDMPFEQKMFSKKKLIKNTKKNILKSIGFLKNHISANTDNDW